MIRTLDSTILNEIANEPQVRVWLGGTQPLDLTETVCNPENFCFLTDEQRGGYIYHKRAPGLYEVHTLALPTGRGRQMLEARSQGLREMFTKTDCVEVVTKVPEGNQGAAVWATKAGFREVFRRAKAFDLMGELVDVSYCSLSYIDWAIRDRGCKIDGQRFHAVIHQFTPDDHGEDPVHDAMVGATMECCLQNNIEKGMGFYCRWAAHAGYEPIRVVTARPLVLDIRTCVLQYGNDGLQVLHIREPRPEGLPIEDVSGVEECLSPPSLPQPL